MSATPQLAPSAQKLILVVDDTPLNIGVISGALKDSYKTKIATNGEKALALASAEEKPDLILLDIMMPGMDGYATMTVIRQMPQFATLPIIAVTARAMPSDRQKSLAAGASDYVTKPVDTDELLNCMERWLAGS